MRQFAESLGYPYTFHSLRHFHASALIKAGVPIKVISERLGHSSISVTMDIYGHLLPGMQKEAAEAFEELLSKSGS
ncbi:MAG: tyrosine-type recombinase/integrase [Firmicutes bacterium]|nr:tyrosine-type recombinase/integrase [Bacillota bacterium]